MSTDTFNDLFMGYVTVMHDAWVDFFFYFIIRFSCLFPFFLVFLVCSEVISLDLASTVVSLRCTVPLAFSPIKYLGLENWDNELGFGVIIFSSL